MTTTTTASAAEELETAIRDKGMEAVATYHRGDREGSRIAWADMARLIEQRSPETVRFLEAQRGLL